MNCRDVERSSIMQELMVGVAQLVEPRVVIPVVVGSSPIVHPSFSAEGQCRDSGGRRLSFSPFE